VNKPLWRCAGLHCVAYSEVLVAEGTCIEGGYAVVRQGRLIAVVGGLPDRRCGGRLRSRRSREHRRARWRAGRTATNEEKAHTEATKEQLRSPGAASEEAPNAGPLSGTDKQDMLDGAEGDDEIRGLGANDTLIGGSGSDVLYGGPGDDFLAGAKARSHETSKDVLYGGPGSDQLVDADEGDDVLYGGDGDDATLIGGKGEDTLYGGDGNDNIDGFTSDRQHRDRLYCGEGWDYYVADKLDYVSSSCEVKYRPQG
jgi:hemolysin type calcium-binding protein